jgi:hypothetical protein
VNSGAMRQIVTVDEFHHEGGHGLAFFQAVDRGDVRMIEGGQHFRFAPKTREPIGIGRERRRQDLDRDLALESRVGGPIHLSHRRMAPSSRMRTAQGQRPARTRVSTQSD